jgi:hypothetical protein
MTKQGQRRMLKTLPFLAALLLAATPALADPVEDGQLWITAGASAKLGGPWQAQLETITRIGNDFDRHYQQETTGLVGYKLSDKATLFGGYANVVDFLANRRDRVEHRPFQQLNLNLGKIGQGTLTARTRFEERFIERADDMGLRFRQQLRYTHPVSGKLAAYGSAEFFFALNDTDWGQRAGFERWRIGAGLRQPIGKTVNVELGYLNQYGYKPTARDTMDHIVTASLSVAF